MNFFNAHKKTKKIGTTIILTIDQENEACCEKDLPKTICRQREQS